MAANRTRAMQVLLEIVKQSPGDEVTGKTKVFKAFYYAHLYYAYGSANYLTDWPIVRMPRGPGIDDFKQLISPMVEQGVVEIEDTMVGPFPSVTFRATGKPMDAPPLEPAAVEAIRSAVELVAGKTAAELSELTHNHSRSWQTTNDGEEQNIYIDLVKEDDWVDALQKNVQAVKADVAAIWVTSCL